MHAPKTCQTLKPNPIYTWHNFVYASTNCQDETEEEIIIIIQFVRTILAVHSTPYHTAHEHETFKMFTVMNKHTWLYKKTWWISFDVVHYIKDISFGCEGGGALIFTGSKMNILWKRFMKCFFCKYTISVLIDDQQTPQMKAAFYKYSSHTFTSDKIMRSTHSRECFVENVDNLEQNEIILLVFAFQMAFLPHSLCILNHYAAAKISFETNVDSSFH